MAVLFQAVLFLVYGIRQVWGDAGLFGTSAILGLTDVDALTVALSASVGDGTPTRIAARALGLGALVNTLAKLGLTLAIGRGAFRGRAGLPLALLAIAGAAALLVW
jgi:uncharacterized membrane protein (DUF4010 family)